MDSSLAVLDHATAAIGAELCQFAAITCPAFNTKKTEAEYMKRMRAESCKHSGSNAALVPFSGHRNRQFNLNTIKLHSLGDYVSNIKHIGTTDLLSTQKVCPCSFISLVYPKEH
jgi:endonuclease/exonuclease/phosphatase family metal-dependent hydrolase